MSSRIGTTFWPNAAAGVAHDDPDPLRGDAEQARANARSSCGVCVDAHTVSSSVVAVHSTTMPRVSIGTGTYICW